MADEEELAALADVLADEYARAILAAVSEEPHSAAELAERLDASPPTVYRRLDRLREADLVDAERRVDPADGHHHEVFLARFRSLAVDLEDGSYEVHVDRRAPDAADRFTELFEGLK